MIQYALGALRGYENNPLEVEAHAASRTEEYLEWADSIIANTAP